MNRLALAVVAAACGVLVAWLALAGPPYAASEPAHASSAPESAVPGAGTPRFVASERANAERHLAEQPTTRAAQEDLSAGTPAAAGSRNWC